MQRNICRVSCFCFKNVRKRNLLFESFLSLFILWASMVYAEGPFREGATEWGLSVGFGDNFYIGSNVKEDLQFYFLTPSWGKVLKKWEGGGSLEFTTEGFMTYARQESEDRYGVGITPLIAYNFKALGKAVLFLELGAGILFTNLDPRNFGSDFNFTPQGGIGVRYEIGPRRFLKLSYRFHHISNAGIDRYNRSIDSHFLLIGFSFFSIAKNRTSFPCMRRPSMPLCSDPQKT